MPREEASSLNSLPMPEIVAPECAARIFPFLRLSSSPPFVVSSPPRRQTKARNSRRSDFAGKETGVERGHGAKIESRWEADGGTDEWKQLA